jgi:hypothetical protein
VTKIVPIVVRPSTYEAVARVVVVVIVVMKPPGEQSVRPTRRVAG